VIYAFTSSLILGFGRRWSLRVDLEKVRQYGVRVTLKSQNLVLRGNDVSRNGAASVDGTRQRSDAILNRLYRVLRCSAS
jgi:hypothetical protein